MSAVYPMGLRRRSPFAPYDENDPQASVEGRGSMYGPNLGPAGGPPPQQPEQQGPPSMFTPAPTGPMPDFSRPQGQPENVTMPTIPPAPSDRSMFAPNQGRRQNIAGDEVPQRPQAPRRYTADDPEVKANLGWVDRMDGAKRFRVAQQMNQDADRTYIAQLNDYQREIGAQEQANYFPRTEAGANLAAETRRGIAETQGGTRENVANIGAGARVKAAEIGAGASTSNAATRRASALEVEKIKAETARELARLRPTGDKTKDDAIARRVIQGRAMVLADPSDPSKGKVYDPNLFNQLLSDYQNKGHRGMGELNQYEERQPASPSSGLKPNWTYRDKSGRIFTTDAQGNPEP